MTDRLEEARQRIQAQRDAKKDIDPMMAFMQLSEDLPEEKRYPYRDEIPEALLQYSDWYTQKTGQEPDKKVLPDWIDTFWYWHSKAIDTQSLDAAFTKFDVVWRPGTLTNTAIALKAQKRATTYKPEMFRASEQQEKKYTRGIPEHIKQAHEEKMKALREKWAREAQERAENIRRAEQTGQPVNRVKTISEVMKGM